MPAPTRKADGALRPALVARLKLRDEEVANFTVFRRAYDARKKTAVVLIYTIDCQLAEGVDEATVLARHTCAHCRKARRCGQEI